MIKTPSYKIVLLGIAAIAQLIAVGSMIINHEKVLTHGMQYKMKTAPVDPYDPFRGKYVRLNIDNVLELDHTDTYMAGETVYAILEEDKLGFVAVSSIQREKPLHLKFIKTKVKYASLRTKNRNKKNEPKTEVFRVTLDLPFQRFYLEEDVAPKAEILYRKHSQSNKEDAHITFRILKGKAVLEGLFIKGIPVAEFVRSSKN
jgi:uncharacterized membrane-anchored protein